MPPSKTGCIPSVYGLPVTLTPSNAKNHSVTTRLSPCALHDVHLRGAAHISLVAPAEDIAADLSLTLDIDSGAAVDATGISAAVEYSMQLRGSAFSRL